MQKLVLGATALSLALGFSAPARADFTLNILHINDFHSRFESITGSDSTCDEEGESKGECFGGIARLKTALEQTRNDLKAKGENVVFLSAGDEFQGSLFYTTYKSKVVADFFNQLGLDAAATGNHEFDDGPEEFAKFIETASFPIVGGNFNVAREPLLAGKIVGVHILDVGSEKIGIVGALAEDTPEISTTGPNVAFEKAVTYVRGAIEALEAQGITRNIVLTHIGYTVDQALAEAVPGIDVIVGGHSHTLLSNTDEHAAGPYPTIVKSPDGKDVPIVTAGQYGKYLGDIKVVWDDDGNVISAKGDPILLDASIKPDEAFIAKVAELGAPIEELKAQVIGNATTAIDGSREVCRAQECTMGNLLADAMLDRVKGQGVSIAIQNGGGLRASIDQGDITMGEVLTVLPFSNTLATFQLKGSDVVSALENGVSDVENGAGRFPQVAGLRFTWTKDKPAGSRIIKVETQDGDNWVAIDPAKTYGVVTNNFMRTGGDGYAVFNDAGTNAYDFGPPLEQVLADFIAAQGGDYTPYTDGRIAEVK